MLSVITVLLSKDNHLYYYHGSWETALKNKTIYSTTFLESTGIGNEIRETQALLEKLQLDKEGKKGLMFIIKPASGSNYQNLIDALDEVLINGVTHYVIVDPGAEEADFIASAEL